MLAAITFTISVLVVYSVFTKLFYKIRDRKRPMPHEARLRFAQTLHKLNIKFREGDIQRLSHRAMIEEIKEHMRRYKRG